MELKNLEIKGLKCYKNSNSIPFYELTVFIGENDAGKSTVLDALGLLLNNEMPRNNANEIDSDFRVDSDTIEITAVFCVENPAEDIKEFIIDNKLTIRKIFPKDGTVKVEVNREIFNDADLNNYESMSADDLKKLLIRLKIDRKSTKEERKDAIKEYIKESRNLPKSISWMEIRLNKISSFLPIFQRYASSDYGNPEASIRKTLDLVYRSWFYKEGADGNEVLREKFEGLRSEILIDINTKLESDLLTHIKRYKSEVTSLGVNCDIDFSRGLSFSGLNIKDSSGKSKSLNQIGEGSKKKIFLSILEWDSEINSDFETSRGIIRGYDEPDSNLHYDAQRKMFYVINDSTSNTESNIQAIICTHSLTMIDRAPAKCINHIIGNESTDESIVEHLESDTDADISEFLNQISEISGIKNSSIFYEKCFLLVEGESEQNALPIAYKKTVGRWFSEDGVILINLQTNGQWNNALKFLHSNKESCTVLLLDSDTQYPTSKNQVTKEKLEQIGFNSNFLTNQCFFIGDKEFEDTILDDQYVMVCNSKFPKDDNSPWTTADFQSIRLDDKFSASLSILLSRGCRRSIGKPEIASAVAEILTKEEFERITPIKSLFEKIQEIVR
ncbi:AAA family ATPase [Candidatus Pacearchaeota archaeon]|nr:AAA family ATPase [Candidatus Pacearchaeota archaeon]